jgi:hypothetical protein
VSCRRNEVKVCFNRETRRLQNPEVGRGDVYPQEADILYPFDITRIIKYSLFLLLARRAFAGTGAIWDVPDYRRTLFIYISNM